MYKCLSGSDWELQGFNPDTKTFNIESKTGFFVGALTPKYQANVPGSVHYDLHKFGVINDPYYESNVLDIAWIEKKCWVYSKDFTVEKWQLKKKCRLKFDGLNFESRIYLNNELLGVHKNIHTPFTCEIYGKLKEKNSLVVVLEPVPFDQGQMGRTSTNKYQSQRFGYGWDFCTTLIGVGIWKKVGLYFYDSLLIDDALILTDYENSQGKIFIEAEGNDSSKYMLRITYENCEVFSKVYCGAFKECVVLDSPHLWFPNTYGNQPLYDIVLSLFSDENLQDEKHYKVGIRSLKFKMNDNSPSDALPYTVVINDKKIWLKGVNLLPFDHMLGIMDNKLYEQYFKLLKDCNVNLIRLWGGGVLENNIFFELCNECGILIWQDFTQSNGGLDGVPCEDDDFLKELKNSTVECLKSNRNITAQTIYTGGNELRQDSSVLRKPVQIDNKNVAMLHELYKQYDSTRIFHTSSPSGKNFAIDLSDESKKNKCNHNTHGAWAYLGKEQHYEYYNACDYLYQGEFGANGASDEDSIHKFFSKKVAEDYKNPSMNWMIKNISWWNSFPRDSNIFGEQNINSLSAYVACSQLIQGEGIRYIVERNRARAFECSGCNIWQFNEPSPNPNCSNLVDYYKKPKQAYYMVKASYAKTTSTLKYSKIYFEKGEIASFQLGVSHYASPISAEILCEILGKKGTIKEYKYNAFLNENICNIIDNIDLEIDESFGKAFFLRVTVSSQDKKLSRVLYQFGTDKQSPYAELFKMNGKIQASISVEDKKKYITLKNISNAACAYISIFPEKTCDDFYIEDNFITLFTNEQVKLEFSGENCQKLIIKNFSRKIKFKI